MRVLDTVWNVGEKSRELNNLCSFSMMGTSTADGNPSLCRPSLCRPADNVYVGCTSTARYGMWGLSEAHTRGTVLPVQG